MKKKKWLKRLIIVFIGGLVVAGGTIYYLFNMPHRDVTSSQTDYKVKARDLVSEYLENSQKADVKYLDEEGDSKIFEVSGIVLDISEDFNKQKVLLLEGIKNKAGVSCTFTNGTNIQTAKIKIGDYVKIKGVIRSGATYDADLEMYENVIIEKSSITNK
jgi:hypothetical protein